METTAEVLRRRVAAVVLLALMVGVGVLTVALYNKSFTKTETITVMADRAGLQMNKGTVVKYKGVDVGKVKSAKPTPEGARIELAMFPDMIGKVPADVVISLEQFTAFGNKGVVLRPREDGTAAATGEYLAAGDEVTVEHIAVEANQIFENLESVLTTAEPAKVSAVLTGMATMLDGQGDRLGQSLETAERYLTQINADMPALQRDFDRGADVLDIYSDASGDILGALGSVTTTADTIAENRDGLATLWSSVTSVAEEGTRFTAANKDRLDRATATYLPTMQLLERYSPVLTCTFQMAAEGFRRSDESFGTKVPGLMATVAVLAQGGTAYENPIDLPDMGMDYGPNCYDWPNNQGQYVPDYMLEKYDTGLSDKNYNFNDRELSFNGSPLSVLILGNLATEYLPILEGAQ